MYEKFEFYTYVTLLLATSSWVWSFSILGDWTKKTLWTKRLSYNCYSQYVYCFLREKYWEWTRDVNYRFFFLLRKLFRKDMLAGDLYWNFINQKTMWSLFSISFFGSCWPMCWRNYSWGNYLVVGQIVFWVDPIFFGPLWQFSFKHPVGTLKQSIAEF